MKLLVLIIAVIIMSFAESTHAQNQPGEGKVINSPYFTDEQLQKMREEKEKMGIIKKNQKEKNKIQSQINADLAEIIPGQIELERSQKIFGQIIAARDLYLECIRTSEEDECTDLKKTLDDLNSKNNDDKRNQHENESEVLNDYVIRKIEECSQIAKEYFPSFRAVVKVDFTINEHGTPITAYINKDESEISHNLYMFSKCVEFYSRKLQFRSDNQKIASFSKNFIL